MHIYTVETTYHLPVYRQRNYSADTPAQACRLAIEDKGWGDVDTSGETHLTGIWEGENAAYDGSPITIPSQFDEAIERRAHHFEILLGLLKMLFHNVQSVRPPSVDWVTKSAWAIARGEAILACAPSHRAGRRAGAEPCPCTAAGETRPQRDRRCA